MRPLDHSAIDKPADDLDYGAEALRWFDCWLKGIDNGIMAESPIRYATMQAGKPAIWRTAREWPPRRLRTKRLYFAPDGSGLSELLPTDAASDSYPVNYTTTTGTRSRTAIGLGRSISRRSRITV